RTREIAIRLYEIRGRCASLEVVVTPEAETALRVSNNDFVARMNCGEDVGLGRDHDRCVQSETHLTEERILLRTGFRSGHVKSSHSGSGNGIVSVYYRWEWEGRAIARRQGKDGEEVWERLRGHGMRFQCSLFPLNVQPDRFDRLSRAMFSSPVVTENLPRCGERP